MSTRTLGSLLGALALAAAPASAKEVTIKIATLAPEGTSWMNVMQDYDKELRERTGGQVGFRFYPGGVAGDEKVVLRKMKAGQLQGGAFTGMGLGELQPWVRILEIPFLYRSYGEIDYVKSKLDERLRAEYEKKGAVVLGWAESGFAHLFSTRRLLNLDDVRGSKPWVWEGDPLAEKAFEAFGVHPTPLALPDVLTSLQTGLIDTVYVSPMASIGLQWFSKVKYMTSEPISDGQGAVLIQKSVFDKLSSDQQKALLELGKKHAERLCDIARRENKDALPTLKEKGIEVLEWAPKDVEGLAAIGEKVADALAGEGEGKLFPKELLEEVRGHLRDFRAKAK
jgi:TRAP-type C4-dicarboxylate transport system substrate-binding protein